MSGEFKFTTEGCKTYKTADNARKAVEKKGFAEQRHFIMMDDNGRFFPVFIGTEAMDHGIHFHFHVVA